MSRTAPWTGSLMIVAVSGPPGSGKTTVAERIAKTHRYELVSVGALFRERADDFSMSLEKFGRYAEGHPVIDQELDANALRRVGALMKEGKDVVVDGRLQPWLLKKNGIPCLTDPIDAPFGVRADRIAGREGKSLDQSKKALRERERYAMTRNTKTYE